ncbi:16S rRNA (guanine(966)-N(2))-methyltransferase RsmD [Rheinheimera baltica]|uniref:Ribosomal RNA small subunit methyltransferase D n=1 Tax=Rheinheimera baltica TaxID=67576 RepID=A0ABT9I018_9GAMM|nr:16S rRNA (guanine(966)-N(2))-methyltransferase RsmD [Rheinheimera baltica]MDP5136737.1 16S rRNA (guanine(966)-N(2))-methyltransferase RsmD [Rheinheimera baltica]MDP5188420.1 16S rRNA (guanine(966)-N(2))-methyltransferase RsmD [Rheinheimera baltica]
MKQVKSPPKNRSNDRKLPPAVSGAPGEVRVISGKWRGRKLAVLNADGLRPTTDRVKETLFNWLMHNIDGATVLDCFAGSGSLAIEALSRHASKASLIERDSKLARHLEQNLQKLSCDNANVVNQDCLSVLSGTATQQYSIVFIDPPFRKNLAISCCKLLESNQWLTSEALIYLETEKELAITDIPANWRLLKEKIAGQLAYRLYQRG